MSLVIDKEWMKELNRASPRYLEGIARFLDFVNENRGHHTRFSCSCRICRNGRGMVPIDHIVVHLLENGIDPLYKIWHFHGEREVKHDLRNESVQHDETFERPRMEELVNDAFDIHHDFSPDSSPRASVGGPLNVDKKFESIYARAIEDLYPSCPEGVTTLYTVVKLNSVKTKFGWSDTSVTALLELMKEILPVGNTLPTKYQDIKNMIKEVGMDYESYHACPNDCILYRKEHSDKVSCPICNAPRYKVQLNATKKATKVPQKTARHFPLIPRLKRLYSIPWIANAMTWHYRAQSSTVVMRHPVDSCAWRSMDLASPAFAAEPRNIRLGIATDGFSPHAALSSTYTCWPVIVVPYNFPPSMCMKREFSMLSLLISGPKALGKDIDVYLEPLVDELKELWAEGVSTYDAFSKNHFTLRAMLLWAIHDFPAYGTLSGCITRGYKACPVCSDNTYAEHLPHSKKICYMGHRRL